MKLETLRIFPYFKTCLLSLVSCLLSLVLHCQAPPPPPPVAVAENEQELLKIDSTLDVIWDHINYCNTVISSELFTASSNRGFALLNNGSLNDVTSALVAMDSIGVKGVSLTVNYPVLVVAFPHSSDYLAFYQQVVKEIRGLGYKLLITCNASLHDTVINKLNTDNFCLNINSQRYKSEKTQMLQTIIDSLQPDYLTIENEPSACLKAMGLNYTVDSVTSYVNYFISNINKKQTKLGAGTGTWENMAYIKSYVKINSLDYIDMHIAPVYFNYFINNAVTIDSLAKVNSKTVMIGNSWLYKATSAEIASDTINVYDDRIIARNAFDSYITDDSLFIVAIYKLSNMLQTEFSSYYWSQFLFGYINYVEATYANMPPYQILDIAYPLCIDALNNKILSVPGTLLSTLVKQKCNQSTINYQLSTINYPYADIYPNPINDNLNIDLYLPRSENVIVKIIDLQGKVVMEAGRWRLEVGTSNFQLLTSGFEEGIYILLLQNSDFTITKKFIKVKSQK